MGGIRVLRFGEFPAAILEPGPLLRFQGRDHPRESASQARELFSNGRKPFSLKSLSKPNRIGSAQHIPAWTQSVLQCPRKPRLACQIRPYKPMPQPGGIAELPRGIFAAGSGLKADLVQCRSILTPRCPEPRVTQSDRGEIHSSEIGGPGQIGQSLRSGFPFTIRFRFARRAPESYQGGEP